MQTLSQLLHALDRDGAGLQVDIDPSWLQGRSLFGGVQAILAVEAMQDHAGTLPLRTLQATLCAPVPAGLVRVQARELRRGKNTVHVEATILDGDNLLATFIGIFGQSRPSAIVTAYPPPEFPPDAGTRFPFIPGLMPDFLQHFTVDVLAGNFPFSGHADTQQIFRATLKDEASQASTAHLLAYADYPPPVALAHLRTPTPGSTLTWMLNLLVDNVADEPLADWLIDVRLDAARDGYTHQSLALYAPSGTCVALGRQCMVVFG